MANPNPNRPGEEQERQPDGEERGSEKPAQQKPGNQVSPDGSGQRDERKPPGSREDSGIGSKDKQAK